MLGDSSSARGTWPRQLPALWTCGQSLDTSSKAFAPLRESSGTVNDPEPLRHKLADTGYLFLRGFFDRGQVQDARRSLLQQLHKRGFLLRGSDPCEARANSAQPTGRAFGNPLDQADRAVRDVVFGPRMMSFFDSFFADAAAHFDYIWFRTKGPGRGTSVHCDIVYMGRGTANLVSAWTPLGDIDLDLGGLIILEDSQHQSERLRRYLSKDVDEYCMNRPDAQQYASGDKWWNGTLSEQPASLRSKLGGRWLTAEYEMGDLVLFETTTIHGSLDNQTDRIRLSVDTRYQRASEPIDHRWVGQSPAGHRVAMKRGRVC